MPKNNVIKGDVGLTPEQEFELIGNVLTGRAKRIGGKDDVPDALLTHILSFSPDGALLYDSCRKEKNGTRRRVGSVTLESKVSEDTEESKQAEHWIELLEEDALWKHGLPNGDTKNFNREFKLFDSLSELETEEIKDAELKASIEAIQAREQTRKPLYLLPPEVAEVLEEKVNSDIDQEALHWRQEFYYFPERRRPSYLPQNILGRLEQHARLMAGNLKILVPLYCGVESALDAITTGAFWREDLDSLQEDPVFRDAWNQAEPDTDEVLQADFGEYGGGPLRNRDAVEEKLRDIRNWLLKLCKQSVRNLKIFRNPYTAYLVLHRHFSVEQVDEKVRNERAEQVLDLVRELPYEVDPENLRDFKERVFNLLATHNSGKIIALCQLLREGHLNGSFDLEWLLTRASDSEKEYVFDLIELIALFPIDITRFDEKFYDLRNERRGRYSLHNWPSIYQHLNQHWRGGVQGTRENAYTIKDEAHRRFFANWLEMVYIFHSSQISYVIHVLNIGNPPRQLADLFTTFQQVFPDEDEKGEIQLEEVDEEVDFTQQLIEALGNRAPEWPGINVRDYLLAHINPRTLVTFTEDKLRTLADRWPLLALDIAPKQLLQLSNEKCLKLAARICQYNFCFRSSVLWNDVDGAPTPVDIAQQYTDDQIQYLIECYQKNLLKKNTAYLFDSERAKQIRVVDCLQLMCFTPGQLKAAKDVIASDKDSTYGKLSFLNVLVEAKKMGCTDSQLQRLFDLKELIMAGRISVKLCLQLNEHQLKWLLAHQDRLREERQYWFSLPIDEAYSGFHAAFRPQYTLFFYNDLLGGHRRLGQGWSNTDRAKFFVLCLAVSPAIFYYSVNAVIVDFIQGAMELVPVHRWVRGEAWLQDWLFRALTFVVAAGIGAGIALLPLHVLTIPLIVYGLSQLVFAIKFNLNSVPDEEKYNDLFKAIKKEDKRDDLVRLFKNFFAVTCSLSTAAIIAKVLQVSLEKLLNLSLFSPGAASVGVMVASAIVLVLVAWSVSRTVIDVTKYCLSKQLQTDFDYGLPAAPEAAVAGLICA